VGWPEVQALVAASVQHEEEDVPALGIVLRVPFARPVLVDGVLPNLDYAIPIADLARRPFVGITESPAEIVSRAADYARPAGVQVLGLAN
jgi:hypothetical protein